MRVRWNGRQLVPTPRAQPAARAHWRRGRTHYLSSVPIQAGAAAYDGYAGAQARYGKPWHSRLMRAPTGPAVALAQISSHVGQSSARSTARGRRYHAQLTNHSAVAWPVELHILHEVVEGSRIFRGHAIVELNYHWAAPVVSGSRTLGSASMSASSPRSVMAGMRSQRPSSGKSSISPAETSSVMSIATAPVRRPQPQLPTARPPENAAYQAATDWPATQRGAESCTPMLNSVHVHTAPAKTRAAAVTTEL